MSWPSPERTEALRVCDSLEARMANQEPGGVQACNPPWGHKGYQAEAQQSTEINLGGSWAERPRLATRLAQG